MSSPDNPAAIGPTAAVEALADPAATAREAEKIGSWTAGSLYALSFLTLISTLNYFDRYVLSIVLPQIKAEMNLSDTQLGFISSLVAIYAVVGIPVAWLADRWSRRNVVAIGFAFWSAMTFMTGFATNLFQLGVARALMAAGESCGVAPSQSMLSDIFSKTRLPVAVAIFTCASSIASLVFSPMAGWVADNYGWRVVFYLAGAPGVILALVFVLTVKEPKRGGASAKPVSTEKYPASETLKFLFGSKAFICMILGSAFMGSYLYGISTWTPSFMTRVHGLTLTEVGLYFGSVRGIVGAVGIILGGVMANWLAKRDERWRGWTPGIACFLVAPCEALFVFADPTWMWVVGLATSSFFAIMHQPAVYAGLMAVAKPRMRALAVSINLLCATVVGQLVGPILIGGINDALTAQYGDLAIRYSLAVVIVAALIGGGFFFAAGSFIPRDTERANAA